jgi:long-chain acyl-CoA synthetase
VFGQATVMGTALRADASLSLLARFDAEDLLDLIRRDKLTIVLGVPTMWNALLHSSAAAGPEQFASLRLAASGGAPLPAEILRAFEERFGCVILKGYGPTETTAAATFNGLWRPRKPVRTGEVGEVYVRGPVVMKGYWNRPDATAEALADGWLRTGDLGTRDGDGDLRIAGRKKDLLIRGGYNVYPREVEEVLYEHPDIVEAAVIGVPDEHYGEEVAAVLAPRPHAVLDPAALRAWAKQRLSAYKVPHLFVRVDQLPKGPTGKILKRAIDRDAIRAQAGGGLAARAGR